MIVGVWGRQSKVLKHGKIFKDPNLGIHENSTMKFNKLYNFAINNSVELVTLDQIDYSQADCFLLLDFPISKTIIKKIVNTGKKVFLIMDEPAVVTGIERHISEYDIFEKVFTWSDDLVSFNEKFIKINAHSFLEEKKIDISLSNKDSFLTQICQNIKSTHKQSLYEERLKVSKWYEKNFPELFDLYGMRWDEYRFPINNNTFRYFNSRHLKFFRRLFATHRPSWRGAIPLKKEILAKYKFAIAFDNAKELNGYILEKIFDVFAAGTVPIYFGAPNIYKHIPPECYIDYSSYSSIGEMHEYLYNMSDNEYLGYLNNIQNFFDSESSYQFSGEYFNSTIVGEIKRSM
jgi:alpha(1,3/1,4) fucosyltransferase